MIHVAKLQKFYGSGENRLEVLKSIDLEIPSSNITCVLGPSGSGKSTLLNILGGIESIDGGSVVVDDIELNDLNRKQLETYRRQNVGFVFQFYNLVNNLTVRENILTGAYLSDSPLDLETVAKSLGISEQLDKFPSQLSGGQAQRTSIARALIKRPQLLICDEPTGALDYESSRSVLKLIEFLNQKYQVSVLLASHNAQIAKMCDNILEIHDGRVKSYQENSNKVSAEQVTW